MILLYAATIDLDCFAVRLTLGIAGLDYRQEPVDVFPAVDAESRRYLALSRERRLPILVADERATSGLVPVLRRIATELAPTAGLWPDTHVCAAEPWLDYAATQLRAVHAARDAGLTGPGMTQAQLAAARRALLVLDDHLTARRLRGHRWISDTGPTIADLALYPAAALVRDLGLEPGEFPAVRAWCRDVRLLAPSVAMPGILDPL